MTLSSLGGGKYQLTFTAPGDDGPCGTPAAYLTRAGGKKINLNLTPAAGGSSFSAEITLPAGARRFSLQARDDAGNLGPMVKVRVP